METTTATPAGGAGAVPSPITTGGGQYYLPGPNPASVNATDQPTPAAMALPVNGPSLATDASTVRKFYTLTASLREIYDDNVNTVKDNPQSGLDTELSPSVLVDFPSNQGDFSARYTFDITYYSNGSNNGEVNSTNNGSLEYTHEVNALYSHAFSARYSLTLAEDFRYFTEPSLDESVGTAYRDGAYISNVLNGTLSSQWTPLFGTTTSYSNDVVRYDEADIAEEQDYVENTGTQVLTWATFPKVSLSVGGSVDDLLYESGDRGYISYTGFGGALWQILPSLSVSGRAGATYFKTVDDLTSISPYASLSLSWQLGGHSSLSLEYDHEISPSDQVGANGQTSDRVSGSFSYNITPLLSAHLSSTVTYADVSNELAVGAASISTTELIVYLDTGLTYHYNTYLNFDTGVTISGVSASEPSNGPAAAGSYQRDEVYLGVRGTY